MECIRIQTRPRSNSLIFVFFAEKKLKGTDREGGGGGGDRQTDRGGGDRGGREEGAEGWRAREMSLGGCSRCKC